MWAWLLGTKLGRSVLGLAVVLVLVAGAGGAGIWKGYRWGHDRAEAQSAKQLADAQARAGAAMLANGDNLATIAALRLANERWAAQAEVSEARARQAVAAAAAKQQASKRALAAAQRKLQETIHDTPDAARWGAERVPRAVLCQLRDDAADCSN